MDKQSNQGYGHEVREEPLFGAQQSVFPHTDLFSSSIFPYVINQGLGEQHQDDDQGRFEELATNGEAEIDMKYSKGNHHEDEQQQSDSQAQRVSLSNRTAGLDQDELDAIRRNSGSSVPSILPETKANQEATAPNRQKRREQKKKSQKEKKKQEKEQKDREDLAFQNESEAKKAEGVFASTSRQHANTSKDDKDHAYDFRRRIQEKITDFEDLEEQLDYGRLTARARFLAVNAREALGLEREYAELPQRFGGRHRMGTQEQHGPESIDDHSARSNHVDVSEEKSNMSQAYSGDEEISPPSGTFPLASKLQAAPRSGFTFSFSPRIKVARELSEDETDFENEKNVTTSKMYRDRNADQQELGESGFESDVSRPSSDGLGSASAELASRAKRSKSHVFPPHTDSMEPYSSAPFPRVETSVEASNVENSSGSEPDSSDEEESSQSHDFVDSHQKPPAHYLTQINAREYDLFDEADGEDILPVDADESADEESDDHEEEKDSARPWKKSRLSECQMAREESNYTFAMTTPSGSAQATRKTLPPEEMTDSASEVQSDSGRDEQERESQQDLEISSDNSLGDEDNPLNERNTGSNLSKSLQRIKDRLSRKGIIVHGNEMTSSFAEGLGRMGNRATKFHVPSNRPMNRRQTSNDNDLEGNDDIEQPPLRRHSGTEHRRL